MNAKVRSRSTDRDRDTEDRALGVAVPYSKLKKEKANRQPAFLSSEVTTMGDKRMQGCLRQPLLADTAGPEGSALASGLSPA